MKHLSKCFAAPFLLSCFLLPGLSSAATVHLSRHPGSDLEKIASSLNSDLIKDSQMHGEKPVIFTTSMHLGDSKEPAALFVSIQSGRLCGAAGCATSIYLLEKGQWTTILDDINGEISTLSERHKGMLDILVDKTDKWIWDGQRYVEVSGANN
ncbi:hypothetical protein FAI41_08205 [Acetobacteraceae bacterium]|nr:hypothetical protein FAI41_08205 [Acetobacteraceae bacterium]